MDKQTKQTVIFFCLLKLALHLIADSHSGFQGDELLHIETGNHLAFGYMEFPPLIGLLAFIQNLFQSSSVFVHHLFAHLASLLIVLYAAKTTVALGGKAKAVLLVLLCIVIAPAFGRSQQLFQPVVFSQLCWTLSFYQLVRYVKQPDRRYLWYLTGTVALGFLTKYDALFFIAGLAALLCFKTMRQALVRHRFWWNILAFLVVISPNILWQYDNGFPVFDMFARLYETQLDHLSPMGVFIGLVISLNPVTLLVTVPAVIAMLHPSMKRFRPLAASIGLSALLLACMQGKSYYFYPIVLTILPFGGVLWENTILPKRKWLIYPLAGLLLIGAPLIPFGMPVFPLESYIAHDYPYEKQEIEGGEYAIRFEERYSQTKWHETLNELKSVVDSLHQHGESIPLIWGKHYSQAGAIARYGERYGLPPAFSLHGSFYNWLPQGTMPSVIIAIRNSKADGSGFFAPFFEEVIPVKSIYNPYADEDEELWQTIFICKHPRQDFEQLKERFAKRVFE